MELLVPSQTPYGWGPWGWGLWGWGPWGWEPIRVGIHGGGVHGVGVHGVGSVYVRRVMANTQGCEEQLEERAHFPHEDN